MIPWRNFLPQLKGTVGLPHFSFREIKSSGKYETFSGKFDVNTFPSEEIPSIIGFEGILDGNGVQFGYKTNPNENRLIKSDETKAYYLESRSVCELEPTHRIVFTNLDYKKFSTNTIQSISIELRTETGQLVAFSGTGKVILTLQFKELS